MFLKCHVTLLLHVLKSEVFIQGAGGRGSRPPLSEFSGSAHVSSQLPTTVYCIVVFGSTHRLGGAAKHFFDGSKERFVF